MGSPLHKNRLIHEKSPYLLQHADNPVDWYPWGQEAFGEAKRLDRPIFLSIGYATCHWCHVMERESFENLEIAKLMNDAFINIKVDREELPEVDSIYMEFAQALMASAGGWPLNLVLTCDLKPFFAITYLPPVSGRGLIGMTQFIDHICQLWKSDERKQLIDQADKIVELFEKMTLFSGEDMPEEGILHKAIEFLYQFTDPIYGGLKGEPKFPMSYQSILLLDYAWIKGDSRALFCAQLALDKMHHGGLYDQLGGGFSRYVIDEKWVIPHFEKMLYDNAILARAYLDAWKLTKNSNYRKVCEETLQYILREMSHPDGGFYSAEDADSDETEGLYYTWTLSEVREILSEKEEKGFCTAYNVTSEGNFEGRNILHVTAPLEEIAQAQGIPLQELEQMLQVAKEKLWKKRKTRTRPFVDDKILTSWNGLLIDALARACFSFGVDAYGQAACKAATFIKTHLWKEGRLLRRYREQDARFSGKLDDYAFLIKGLLSLFDQKGEAHWLQWAMELADVLEKEFKVSDGAYYYHLHDPALLFRKCEYYDGAEPSANAVHAENLMRLFQITFSEKYLKQAEDIFRAAKMYIETYPPGACYHLIALNRYFHRKAPTLVIALDEQRNLEKEIKEFLASAFHPHAEIIWKSHEDTLLSALIPSLVDKKPIDGQTAVYICRQGQCEVPLIQKEDILKALRTDFLTRG